MQWSRGDIEINVTSFTAISNGNYFNCGGSHSLKDCRKPQNGERIKANKQVFYKKNRKAKGKSDAKKVSDLQKKCKWYPPTDTEKKNRGCCNIDGKEYYYHYRYKRWKIVDNPTPPTGNSSLHVAAVVVPPAASTYGSVATLDQSQEVTLATSTNQISDTICGLISQLK